MPEPTPAPAPSTGTAPDANNPPAPTPPSTAPNPAPPTSDPAAEQQLTAAVKRADEAGAERDQLRAALDAVTKALNPDGAEAEQDPAKLAAAVADRDKQLDQVAAELRAARVELAAYKAAGEQGARADRLLNSRAFADALAQLDPADAKFGEQLAAAIKSAVEADPDLYGAAPSGPARGGGEFNGAPAGERRAATLHDAVAARLSGA